MIHIFSIGLRVDANQGWSVNDALKVMSEYEKYDVKPLTSSTLN